MGLNDERNPLQRDPQLTQMAQAQSARTPEEYEAMCERSYKNAEDLIAHFQKLNKLPEGAPPASRFEHKNDQETLAFSNEANALLSTNFDVSEVMDPMQNQISIKNKFSDSYTMRNEQGKLAGLVSSARLNIPATVNDPESIALIMWYAARDPEHKGPSMMSALYEPALRDALPEARQRHVPFECIV